MSTLPDFTGPGFFAGEAPDGLTTVVSTPQPAEVRVYWRDPEDANAEDVFVASTLSATDGTWRIDNLNPELQYVVRGRKAGFDDVTVVGATPSRTDVITVENHLQPTAEFDGLDGYVLMDSGLTPFTASVVDPLPFGLSTVIDGRKLLIEGVSDDEGLWQSTVRVTASNAVTVDVPVQVVIGLKSPVVTARYAVDGDWTITLQLAGGSAFAQELRVYRSTSPIDVEDLPDPVAVLNADVVKWVDDEIEIWQVYHYQVSVVLNDLQVFSAAVKREAVWTPADLNVKPKILLTDKSPIQDVSERVSAWENEGSLGGAFIQSDSARRPLYVEDGVYGKRLLRFDGVDDYLIANFGDSLFTNVEEGWVFLVANNRLAGAERYLFSVSTGVGQARFNLRKGSKTICGVRRLDSVGGASLTSVKDVATGSFEMTMAHMSWASALLKLQIDGALDSQLTVLTPGQTQNTLSAMRPTIGASNYGSIASFAQFDLAAVIVGAGSAPTNAEIDRLSGWAAHQYGLTSRLPANHPYKLTPP